MDLGDIQAMNNLGECYRDGNEATENIIIKTKELFGTWLDDKLE